MWKLLQKVTWTQFQNRPRQTEVLLGLQMKDNLGYTYISPNL